MKKLIEDSNIPKRVDHITHEEDEEIEKEEAKKVPSDNEDDDLITDQDRLNFLLNNEEENKQSFTLSLKKKS